MLSEENQNRSSIFICFTILVLTITFYAYSVFLSKNLSRATLPLKQQKRTVLISIQQHEKQILTKISVFLVEEEWPALMMQYAAIVSYA